MGLKEFNALRHPEGEEVEDLPVPDWDRGDVILGSWQNAAEYQRNLQRLEDRGMVPRHEDDERFLRRLYGGLMD